VLNHFEFADIERVEVAKGPQGTLFGRNATGGAISIYTRSPSFAPAGNFTLGYGNFNRVFANGFLTGPLVGESLAGSVSLYYERHAGYDFDRLRNRRTDGLDSKSFRAKLLWRPVDWASITLSGSYQKRNDSDTGSGIPLNGNTEARLDPSALIPTRPHSTSFDTDTFVHFNHYAATIRGEFELPKGRLTTIGAFSRANARISYDADRSNSQTFKTAYIYSQPESMFSQEISYSSDKIGRVKYLVGAYYYRDNNRFYPNRIALGSDPASDVWYNSSNPVVAAALFSEADIDLNDRLTFIGGARYSWERRENKGALRVGGAPSGPLLQGPKVSFRSWTPRLSIMYQVRSYANLYFTLSRGFKSGGVPNSAFLTPPTGLSDVGYKPEYITAYELGLKATPGRKFSLGFAGYYYDYRDLQVQVQIPNGLVNIQNAASARIYGLDLDGAWRINEELSVRSSVALLDARYRQFRNAVVLRPKVNASGIGPSGNENVVIDASGNAMRRAPRYTMSLSAEYAHANKLGKFQLTVATFFTGKVYFDNDERISQRPYGLLNAQLSWRIRSTEVELSVWGKNLTDATYISSSFSQPVADVVGYGPRRTFGVNLVYEF
jgi:iron complex outermembrane receptor protein